MSIFLDRFLHVTHHPSREAHQVGWLWKILICSLVALACHLVMRYRAAILRCYSFQIVNYLETTQIKAYSHYFLIWVESFCKIECSGSFLHSIFFVMLQQYKTNFKGTTCIDGQPRICMCYLVFDVPCDYLTKV